MICTTLIPAEDRTRTHSTMYTIIIHSAVYALTYLHNYLYIDRP